MDWAITNVFAGVAACALKLAATAKNTKEGTNAFIKTLQADGIYSNFASVCESHRQAKVLK
ncbi:hypothetical protein D3C86_2004250 [compost metagenome]